MQVGNGDDVMTGYIHPECAEPLTLLYLTYQRTSERETEERGRMVFQLCPSPDGVLVCWHWSWYLPP